MIQHVNREETGSVYFKCNCDIIGPGYAPKYRSLESCSGILSVKSLLFASDIRLPGLYSQIPPVIFLLVIKTRIRNDGVLPRNLLSESFLGSIYSTLAKKPPPKK